MVAERILVCLDGSGVAEAVLPLAMAIARGTGQKLVLLAVVEADPRLAPTSDGDREAAAQQRRQALEQYLIRSERRLREDGLQVATALMWGDPAGEIQGAATALNASLIAMATHGRGELARWALGSVADDVASRGNRPVLLANRWFQNRRSGAIAHLQAGTRAGFETMSKYDGGERQAPASIQRILVPLDGTALAEAALAPATELARALGARLLLARVVQEYASWTPGHGHVPDAGATERRQTARAETYLSGKATGLPPNLPVESLVLHGAAGAELIALARAAGVDLAVIASHGRTGLSRTLRGSVAFDLIAAGLPTLIVPQGAVTPPATDSSDTNGRALHSARATS
ncbi:MAG TPA: universal stress protein [Dehalococcoidia bacterium]|nr:universal stress protein [Dehalococcoidia bacterium]